MKTAVLIKANEVVDQKRFLKLIEIVFLFIGTPIILWLELPKWTKGSYFLICLIYVIWLMLKKDKLNLVEKKLVNPTKTLLAFGIKLSLIALGSFLFLYFYNPESLFNVISKKPLLWLGFSAIYVLISVIPQEIIYRYFFLKKN